MKKQAAAFLDLLPKNDDMEQVISLNSPAWSKNSDETGVNLFGFKPRDSNPLGFTTPSERYDGGTRDRLTRGKSFRLSSGQKNPSLLWLLRPDENR